MQIKNKVKLLLLIIIKVFFLNQNVYSDEFNISAIEITVDKKKNIVIGEGEVKAVDSQGKIINAAIEERFKDSWFSGFGFRAREE